MVVSTLLLACYKNVAADLLVCVMLCKISPFIVIQYNAFLVLSLVIKFFHAY